MSINTPTRKTLWAKSGNVCAICFKELAKIENGIKNICGEECHIVSEKPNGPRHRAMKNYDSFDNLILLCQEHHKLIDDNPEKYTEKFLLELKKEHEKKVVLKKESLKTDILLCLKKAENARDIVRCLEKTDIYLTDFPVDREEDYILFDEFFDVVYNFDLLENYSEFEKINHLKDSFNKIVNKGYIIVYGKQKDSNKYTNSIIIILTQEQFNNQNKADKI